MDPATLALIGIAALAPSRSNGELASPRPRSRPCPNPHTSRHSRTVSTEAGFDPP